MGVPGEGLLSFIFGIASAFTGTESSGKDRDDDRGNDDSSSGQQYHGSDYGNPPRGKSHPPGR